ncbi:flagellar hook protein FlgE [Fusibacter ferrireducens]|uniref:Flagellar hook protein FlgE n=1 Tax=Fusibacter ferrireducens TaxID=2785058 RepID=A0ABR9ZN37_9FIRM|nr:flagellar hook protein FlgE [Fusibacter ferrireducens]MBF4691731.1 flagellar hook protein FlgE [Fusibacter ferrireducens]
MMRSMFSGVSSLKAHQLRMDVIGNNIANVNTVGYKASNATFSEMYSQTLRGASSSTTNRGGTNPMQVGLGTNIAAVSVNHTKGSIQRTDVATDLMIDGDGFFMVTNDATAQNKFYTRAGNFQMDEQGYLVTTDGLRVLDNEFKPIQVNMSDSKSATTTSNILINGNISTTENGHSTTVDIYDSLGDVHTLKINFEGLPLKTSAKKQLENTPGANTIALNDPLNYNADGTVAVASHNYSYRKMTISDAGGTQIYPGIVAPATVPNDLYALFNEKGEFVDLVEYAPGVDPTTAAPNLDVPSANTLTIKVDGASDISVPIDRSMFFTNGDVTKDRIGTQNSQASDAKAVQLEGRAAGKIYSFNISSKGEVIGIYTNGQQKILQTIGLAAFDNPGGLMKLGGNLFQETPNSGTAKYGVPSTGSFGSLTPGALEMSNVDLAAQFTDMITTQRGFQANSRVITTSDEILQELVNLKR